MGPGQALRWVLFALTGCSSTVPAAATRVLDADASALAATPICFPHAHPDWSLTAKAQYQKIIRFCETAAARQKVAVTPISNGGCLVATVMLRARDTGKREADCLPGMVMGTTCESNAIVAKSMKVTLAESGKRPVAETTAAIQSDFAGFSDESYFALCSAAFRDYPKPLTNEQFNVETE
jgi:hypothetical protein